METAHPVGVGCCCAANCFPINFQNLFLLWPNNLQLSQVNGVLDHPLTWLVLH